MMTELRSVFAVMPAAAAVETAVAAFRALPLGSHARLTGLHVAPITLRYGLAADIALASFIEAQLAASEEERETAKAAFTTACEKAGISFGWRAGKALDTLVSGQAGALSRAADLILYPHLPEEASIGRHAIEEAVFTSGRPVLALPHGWSGATLGRRVLVAWDGGREATRATFDALPLLAKAEAVRIVSVQGDLDEPVRQFTAADDICATLSRHGVPVEAQTFARMRGSVTEELQAQALDFAADLTVMGCYGHSRLRERILGGVSRDVLRDIPFAVLLAS